MEVGSSSAGDLLVRVTLNPWGGRRGGRKEEGMALFKSQFIVCSWGGEE